MIIEHASVNWENYIPKNVKTLVLGSFNPNNPEIMQIITTEEIEIIFGNH